MEPCVALAFAHLNKATCVTLPRLPAFVRSSLSLHRSVTLQNDHLDLLSALILAFLRQELSLCSLPYSTSPARPSVSLVYSV